MSENWQALHAGRRIIIEADDGRVVTGGASGAQARVSAWTGDDAQVWRLILHPKAPSGTCVVQRWGRSEALDVNGESKEDGAKILNWPMHEGGGANQFWHIHSFGGDVYRLVAEHSRKVIGLAQGGDGLVQRSYERGASAQRWRIAELLPYGDAVPLRSHHGHFMTAKSDGAVTNTVDHVRSWERLTFVRPDGTTDGVLEYGDEVAIRTDHGTYLSASPDGDLRGDVGHIKGWERFTITREDGDTTRGPVTLRRPFALRSAHGTYVMAHSNGGVNASASEPRSWERWRAWPASMDGIATREISYPGPDDWLRVSVPSFRCVRPATGIETDLALQMTELGMAVINLAGLKCFSGPVAAGIAIGGLAIMSGGAAAILIDHDRAADQLYFATAPNRGAKVWPDGDYKEVDADQGWHEFLMSHETPAADFKGSVDLYLMEYDSGSDDDVLGVLQIKSEELELLDGRFANAIPVGSDEEDSLYELIFGVESI